MLDGLSNRICPFRLSDASMSVALGGIRVRKSRRDASGTKSGRCQWLLGSLIGTKTPAGSLRYASIGA